LAVVWAPELRRAWQLSLRSPDGKEQRSLRSGLWPDDLSLHKRVVWLAGCALQQRHQGWRCNQPAIWGEFHWRRQLLFVHTEGATAMDALEGADGICRRVQGL